MPLTATAVKQAKPAAKTKRLYDEKGLYLEISPKGGKWWRFKYLIDRKEKRISLGVYPEVSLKDARDRRDENRKLVANGIDPSAQRKAQKAKRATATANSFEAIATEWHEKRSATWSVIHSKNVRARLEQNIFPLLGQDCHQ